LPPVDDVADEKEVLALDMLEEVEQRMRLATGRPEMQVRDPHAAKPQARLRVRWSVGPCAQEVGIALHGRSSSAHAVTWPWQGCERLVTSKAIERRADCAAMDPGERR